VRDLICRQFQRRRNDQCALAALTLWDGSRMTHGHQRPAPLDPDCEWSIFIDREEFFLWTKALEGARDLLELLFVVRVGAG